MASMASSHTDELKQYLRFFIFVLPVVVPSRCTAFDRRTDTSAHIECGGAFKGIGVDVLSNVE
jgi:hypothetical protein